MAKMRSTRAGCYSQPVKNLCVFEFFFFTYQILVFPKNNPAITKLPYSNQTRPDSA